MRKKILLLSAFVFSLMAILYGVGFKNVNAEEVCTKYTNYYLFLDSSLKSDYFTPGFENSDTIKRGPLVTQEYNLNLPEGAKRIEGAFGLVTFSENPSGIDEISLEDFYDYWKASNEGVYSEGNINYVRGSGWNENGSFNTDKVELYEKEDFLTRIPASYGDPDITMEGAGNTVQLSITRTWYKDEIEDLEKDLVYSPAVYYVQYEVCSEDTEYKVNVHYIDKSTNEEIFNNTVQEGLVDGAAYNSYTCPATLENYAGYSLSTNDKKEHEAGVIDGKDVDLYCYYDKKATLTINFGTNKDCSEGTGIRNPETVDYNVGENIKYTIPDIDEYDFSDVGAVSPTFRTNLNGKNLTFEMPNKNTSICLVYIHNPQTGAGWIYFVWIIGIAALAYSGWYFMKYYKNQNNEI